MSRKQYIENAVIELGEIQCYCGCKNLATQFVTGQLPRAVPIAEPSCYIRILRAYREQRPKVLEHFRNKNQFELTRRLL